MKTGMKISEKGFFITFEGIEGSGKSTQITLLSERLEKFKIHYFRTREPGGPPISEKIRKLLLDPENKEMAPLTEALLYQASRAQHVHEWILPKLNEGYVVLSDRFFDASTAYQGVARNLGKNLISQLNTIATNGLQPDLTFVIDVPLEIGLKRGRYGSRVDYPDGKGDRLEREHVEFHEKVKKAYMELCSENERFIRLDGMVDQSHLADQIWELLIPGLTTRGILTTDTK